jgi:hypothetical protein
MLQEFGNRRGFLRSAMLRLGNDELLSRHDDEGGSSPPSPRARAAVGLRLPPRRRPPPLHLLRHEGSFAPSRPTRRRSHARAVSPGAPRAGATSDRRCEPCAATRLRPRERERRVDGEAMGRDKKEEKKRKERK